MAAPLVAGPLVAVHGKINRTQKRVSAPTDDTITDQVRMKLTVDPTVKGGALEVEVKNGFVTLKGHVDTAKQKTRAEQVTRKVKGVRGVYNQIEVGLK